MRRQRELGKDSEGRWRRYYGNKLGNKGIGQHLFRLGKDKAEAERRDRRIKSLWDCVEARWKRLTDKGQTSDPVPLWDDLSLEIGKQLANGETIVKIKLPSDIRAIAE